MKLRAKQLLSLKWMQLEKANLSDELHLQASMKLTQQETSKECPKFKHASPFIWVRSDVAVHLHWNTLWQAGRKEMRVIDWIIIIRLCPLSTGGVHLRILLWIIRNIVYSVIQYLFRVLANRDSILTEHAQHAPLNSEREPIDQVSLH